jgi:hypothetical protein
VGDIESEKERREKDKCRKGDRKRDKKEIEEKVTKRGE